MMWSLNSIRTVVVEASFMGCCKFIEAVGSDETNVIPLPDPDSITSGMCLSEELSARFKL